MPVISPTTLLTAAALLSMAAGLALGHWLPWRRGLHAVFNYIWGVVWVIGPLSLLLVALEHLQAARLVWGFFVAGGIVVVGCYRLDAFFQGRRVAREQRERIALLEQQLDRYHDKNE